MRISECLCEVEFLDVSTRDEAIQTLAASLANAAGFADPQPFFKAVLQREQIVSTGIGMGVAVPHAKLSNFQNFFLVIGIQKIKGIEWNSLDHLPVRLIFLIGGPDDRQGEYLQILSQLTSAIKGSDFRNQLLRATTADEVIALFSHEDEP